MLFQASRGRFRKQMTISPNKCMAVSVACWGQEVEPLKEHFPVTGKIAMACFDELVAAWLG